MIDMMTMTSTGRIRNITIRSISQDGEYYLVSGWNKHKGFWVKWEEMKPEMMFSAERYAKRSLDRLIKVMPEYKSDTFHIVEVKGDGTLVTKEQITYVSS